MIFVHCNIESISMSAPYSASIPRGIGPVRTPIVKASEAAALFTPSGALSMAMQAEGRMSSPAAAMPLRYGYVASGDSPPGGECVGKFG